MFFVQLRIALKELLSLWQQLCRTRTELEESAKLASGTDADLAEMAQADLPELETKVTTLEKDIQLALLPPDPNEDRDAIVEIRAGTGGDEARPLRRPIWPVSTRVMPKPPASNSSSSKSVPASSEAFEKSV
jgi:peptide chain release factor 1